MDRFRSSSTASFTVLPSSTSHKRLSTRYAIPIPPRNRTYPLTCISKTILHYQHCLQATLSCPANTVNQATDSGIMCQTLMREWEGCGDQKKERTVSVFVSFSFISSLPSNKYVYASISPYSHSLSVPSHQSSSALDDHLSPSF